MKKFSIAYFACIFLSPASPAQLGDKVRDLRNECKLNHTRYWNNGEFNTQITWAVLATGDGYLLSGQYYKSIHQ